MLGKVSDAALFFFIFFFSIAIPRNKASESELRQEAPIPTRGIYLKIPGIRELSRGFRLVRVPCDNHWSRCERSKCT